MLGTETKIEILNIASMSINEWPACYLLCIFYIMHESCVHLLWNDSTCALH